MKLIPFSLVSVFLFMVSSLSYAQDNTWVSLEKNTGEGLFVEKCGMCHRQSGMGTGILARRMDAALALLENRQDLQIDYIDSVVRNGLRTMFPLSRGEVGDKQLEKISLYLTAKKD